MPPKLPQCSLPFCSLLHTSKGATIRLKSLQARDGCHAERRPSFDATASGAALDRSRGVTEEVVPAGAHPHTRCSPLLGVARQLNLPVRVRAIAVAASRDPLHEPRPKPHTGGTTSESLEFDPHRKEIQHHFNHW